MRQLAGVHSGRDAHVVLLRQHLEIGPLREERDVHRNAAGLQRRAASANGGDVWSCVGTSSGRGTVPGRHPVKPTAGPAATAAAATAAAAYAACTATVVHDTGRHTTVLPQPRHQVWIPPPHTVVTIYLRFAWDDKANNNVCNRQISVFTAGPAMLI